MIPHFDIPFRFLNNKRAAVTEQDTDAEIMDCVEAIVRYKHGDRPERIEFGIPDFTFHLPGIDGSLIQESIREFEPRADVQVGQTKIEDLIQSVVVRRPPRESD